MNWTDIYDIAYELNEKFPAIDPLTLKFTDLQSMVMSLDSFVGKKESCNEKILETIQMEWLNEKA
jgi:FeS assembly protein IscX